jgi:hypothetical protein
MNIHLCLLRLGALVVVSSAGLVLGCSSSSTSGPSSHVDSGTTVDAAGGSTDDSSPGDDASSVDAASDDSSSEASAPACVSDSSLCNSCTTPEAGDYFYNACGSQLTNCVPFTGTVPAHPFVN